MKLHVIFTVDLDNEVELTRDELKSKALYDALEKWRKPLGVSVQHRIMLNGHYIEVQDPLPPGEEVRKASELLQQCVTALLAERLRKTPP